MPEQVTFDAQRNPSNTRAAARCFNALLLNQVKWHNAHVNRSSHASTPQAAIPEAGNWLVEVALAAHTQFQPKEPSNNPLASHLSSLALGAWLAKPTLTLAAFSLATLSLATFSLATLSLATLSLATFSLATSTPALHLATSIPALHLAARHFQNLT